MKRVLNTWILTFFSVLLCWGEVKAPEVYIPHSTSTTKEYKPKEWFRWEYVASCIKYIIEIDTVATFTSPAKATYTYSNPSKCSTTYLEKEIGNLYLGCFNYWHVQAVYKNDTSAWSNTHQFFTLSKAVATSPNGATDVEIPVILKWEYQYGFPWSIIEVDTTTSFLKPVFHSDRETPNSTWAKQTVSSLKEGTTYYWRMRNYHAKDTTEWSDILSFSTRAPEPARLNDVEITDQPNKRFINGHVYIILDDKRYNATGQRH